MSMRIINAGGGEIDVQDILSWRNYVKNCISSLYETAADVTLTSTASGALQTAIDNISDGEILEIKVDASYSPITIPAGKAFKIKVAYGYDAVVSGALAITLSDEASGVLISGLHIEDYSLGSGNSNSNGQAINLEHEGIVENIIFHNIAIKEIAATGSAALLSYHQSFDGDSYTTPNELNEFSNKIAFVDCEAYGASSGIEHGAFTIRGVDLLYFKRNKIDGQNDSFGSSDSRGIHCQNCFNVLIEENSVLNTQVGNGECIKIDKLGSPSYQNTCWIKDNIVRNGVEGIDVDDAVEALIEGNRVWNCTTEGISIDNDSKGIITNNVVFGCVDGIRAENGATYELHGNVTFDNSSNNIRLDDAGSPDTTNTFNPLYADGVVGELMAFQTRWEDLRAPLLIGAIGLTNPPSLNVLRGNLRAYEFALNDEIFIGFHLPHSYLEGSTAYIHVHYTTDGTDVNTVKWDIEYQIVKVGDAFPVSTTTLSLTDTPSGTAYEHYIIEDSTGFAPGVLQAGAQILCRLVRVTNAGTDNTDAVFGLELDIHYQRNNIGTLNRTPPFNNRS
jgi:parallel beta-helix repeat protein